MLNFIKHQLGRHPKIKETYHALHWKQHIWSDWLNTYIFKKNVQYDTPFGFKMITRNYIANRMMMKATFETDEIELIKENLSNAEVFVDVGANIGLYTCIARALGKYVIAIEPQPQNLSCLYANLKINNWQDTEVFPLGLSSKPGMLILYGASGPSASLISGWAGYSSRYQRVIPVNTLDTLLSERFSGKKLFIKIDVEGAEYNVLGGALKTLSISPKPNWFVEICLNEFHPGGINHNYEATFDLFWRHGYEARIANKEAALVTAKDIKSWGTNKRPGMRNFNYLFIPKQ